jgi:hypothetical protein
MLPYVDNLLFFVAMEAKALTFGDRLSSFSIA